MIMIMAAPNGQQPGVSTPNFNKIMMMMIIIIIIVGN